MILVAWKFFLRTLGETKGKHPCGFILIYFCVSVGLQVEVRGSPFSPYAMLVLGLELTYQPSWLLPPLSQSFQRRSVVVQKQSES